MTEEEIQENAKKSKKIVYTPEVFGEDSKPRISFYKFRNNEFGVQKKDIGVFILKYKIDDILQEVIIGKLENEDNAFEKAKKIKLMIENQLMENSKEKSNYTSLKELKDYITVNEIPFKLTIEGSDIIAYDGVENKEITRTYYEKDYKDKNSTLECMYPPEVIQEMERKRRETSNDILAQMDLDGKWEKRRELILANFKSDEEKMLFLKGEKIASLVQDTDRRRILQERKDDIADYLIENYEMYGDSSNKIERKGAMRFEDYVAIKEKGIAIDAKIVLEEVLSKFEEQLLNKHSEIKPEEKRTMDSLNNYCRFFDLVKARRDTNARILALKISKIDFDVVQSFFSRYASKDKELLKYIELKGKEISDLDVKPEVNIEDYRNTQSIQNLYDFLAHSSVRKYTRENDERKQIEVYNSIKVDLIKDNIKAIQKYNYYAEKNGLYICPLPEGKEAIKLANEKREKIPNSLKKLSEIPGESLDKENKGDEER